MINKSTLETERCILRILKNSDAEDLFKTLGDEDVFKFIPYECYSSLEMVKEAIEGNFIHRFKEGSACEFGVELKSNKEIIGICGYIVIDDGLGILSYLLNKDYWGNGFMTEIVKSVISYGFSQLDLSRIVAYCMCENIASKKVLQNNGFIYVGDGVMNTNGQSFRMSNYILDKG